MIIRPPFILVAFLLFALACGEAVPAAAPNGEPATLVSEPSPTLSAVSTALTDGRLLTLGVTEAAGEEFDGAMDQALALGTGAVPLSVYWDEIESAPGIYNPEPNWLEIANVYYPYKSLEVVLTISVIDTNNERLPADLMGKSYDDPAKWRAYTVFFEQTSAYARNRFPGVPIGVKTTFSGLNGPAAPFISEINQRADVILLTYYPLNGDFNVRPPETVHADFQTINDRFLNQKIFMLEIGYPSGSANGSSEQQQADFIQELFIAWDNHADQFPVINYTWLTDVPAAAVDGMTAYYGLNAPGFVSFLSSLGLRTSDGREKPAFTQFQIEIERR